MNYMIIDDHALANPSKLQYFYGGKKLEIITRNSDQTFVCMQRCSKITLSPKLKGDASCFLNLFVSFTMTTGKK